MTRTGRTHWKILRPSPQTPLLYAYTPRLLPRLSSMATVPLKGHMDFQGFVLQVTAPDGGPPPYALLFSPNLFQSIASSCDWPWLHFFLALINGSLDSEPGNALEQN